MSGVKGPWELVQNKKGVAEGRVESVEGENCLCKIET